MRAFLISSALFWLEKYHADALRVDAVASMLYLDYARKPGEWIPNEQGGRENLEAVKFLQQLNTEVYRSYPDVHTIAEESTAWPLVTRPVDVGGLGFGLKWDMGWMHDTLEYLALDPVHRRHHHTKLSFRSMYMYSENYVLPLSHDEVVHMKSSLIGRMPGDRWRKFANLRLLLVNQWTQPGKKLLFMGGEFGQWGEWNFKTGLEWSLTQHEPHQGIQRLVTDLNAIYRASAALHEGDCDPAGFQWVQADDTDHSVLAFLRRGKRESDAALVVFNYTPVPRTGYRLGVPTAGAWREVLNSDAADYGGSGMGNMGRVKAEERAHGAFPASLTLTLPPLGALVLTPRGGYGGPISSSRAPARAPKGLIVAAGRGAGERAIVLQARRRFLRFASSAFTSVTASVMALSRSRLVMKAS